MNHLYYCTTPFQLLIALNMRVNGTLKETESDNSIIVLVDIFKDCKAIAERLYKEHIFDEVFVVNEEPHKNKKNGGAKFIQIAVNTVFPKTMVKYQFGNNAGVILNRKYDVIVSSVFCHPVAALLTLNPQSTFIMMDDGLASYFGNWTSRIRSTSYLKLLKIRNFGRDISTPSSLYVMRKEFCKSTITPNILQLPALDDQLLSISRKVFGITENKHIYRERIILLSQPAMDEATKEVFGRIIEKLENNKNDIIVRGHPRETDFSLYKNCSIDKTGNMWEMLVSTEEIEKKLLITSYSTAVFTPKLLYDREPWIIFMHQMLNMDLNIEDIIDQLRQTYKNKERICEVKNWDEFDSFIRMFVKDNTSSTNYTSEDE